MNRSLLQIIACALLVTAWLPAAAKAGPPPPGLSRQWQWLDRDWGGALVPGPYRSYISLFLVRYRSRDITLWQEDEWQLYRDLLAKSIKRPQYILLEFTAYPLAGLAAWLQDSEPGTYRRFDLGERFNLVRSLGAGYQEPWSVSLFVGQLADFWDLDDQDELVVASSGASGLVLTGGGQQIFDNAVVNANWMRLEWKLKGQGQIKGRRRFWDLKVGYRWYGLSAVDNTITITFKRQRTNRTRRDWGLRRNTLSAVELQLPPARAGEGFTRVSLEYGKVFPLWKVLFGLKVGYIHENRREYDAVLGTFSPARVRQSEIYIQPIALF